MQKPPHVEKKSISCEIAENCASSMGFAIFTAVFVLSFRYKGILSCWTVDLNRIFKQIKTFLWLSCSYFKWFICHDSPDSFLLLFGVMQILGNHVASTFQLKSTWKMGLFKEHMNAELKKISQIMKFLVWTYDIWVGSQTLQYPHCSFKVIDKITKIFVFSLCVWRDILANPRTLRFNLSSFGSSYMDTHGGKLYIFKHHVAKKGENTNQANL